MKTTDMLEVKTVTRVVTEDGRVGDATVRRRGGDVVTCEVRIGLDDLVALLWHDYAFRKVIAELNERRIEPPMIEPDVIDYFFDLIGMPPEADGEFCRDYWHSDWYEVVEAMSDYDEEAARRFIQKTVREVGEIQNNPDRMRRNGNPEA